jgi:hypothetical protein
MKINKRDNRLHWPENRRRRNRPVGRPQNIAACHDFVGRAPWPAVDPLVDLLEYRKSRLKGSGADEGVGPTFAGGARLPRPFAGGSSTALNRAVAARKRFS